MADDKLKGTFEEMKGKVKEGVGDLTDNEKMKREGEMDQLKGKAQKSWGDVKDTAQQAGQTAQNAVHDMTSDSDTTNAKEKVKGTAHQAAGTAKEKYGEATDNTRLQGEGMAEKTEGKVERKAGDM